MVCLCCGRAVSEGHAFCEECQARMEAYPVKPGTAIHLPHQNAPVAVKKRSRRKKPISQEEYILHLRKSLRQTRVFLVLTVLVLCLAVSVIAYQTFRTDDNIGRNYNVDTTQATD